MKRPEDWDRAVEVLAAAPAVSIACHVNPDGDALGSLLAASLGLRQLGKETYPSWGTRPVAVPPSYAFLPGSDSVLQVADVPSGGAFLALDCGAVGRLGDLQPVASKAENVINVDHHPGNDDFGHLNLVVTEASSTAELVMRLLLDLGVNVDLDIATCLYTGIVTDTGSFQYANASPDTLRLAADLLGLGVSAPAIAQEVFESAPFGFLKLAGRVLDRAELCDEGLVWSWVGRKDLAETGVHPDESDQLIDMIRSTRDADIAALFKEQRDGGWKVSLRSKGPRTVGHLARARGGGKHDLAADFTVAEIEPTVADLRRDLGAK